ncbi:MAG: DsrE family protein [Cyclobacteriaceae bacterium]
MRYTLTILLLVILSTAFAQKRVNPVIKNFGGIYDIPEATVRPDPNQEYKIVIDVYGGTDDKVKVDRSLNNVARMLNLHAVGGVDPGNMKVVLALHAKSTYSILDDESYKEKFGSPNPNIALVRELKKAGVRITVCGQSLRGREVENSQVLTEVEIATSMLTTVTSYQMKGYQLLKF